ncbi:riboflavin biosynthesis protein [Sporosarcina sp. NCCP-2716]|uniref:bifunctional riboflavin kinase/FAD synthetase n=1 Tax=Sporosarcina sp. NCCP-2716 TaxID=2943679 RepID=UPI00203FA250|nr:bifunctional riboflavin kinase/FAD synthetase [Sporosarcina sp. NCCP-2716]GKV67844.1 riboflavin biosynthesis protein [Sporosarcina sp. NCCP-2716]
MEVIKLDAAQSITPIENKEFSLAVGFFDGLHKGHQAVIREAVREAEERQLLPAVMTFDPHPSHLFSKEDRKIGYITPLSEKERLLSDMGIDTLFIVTFDKALADLSPARFVEDVLKKLNVRHVTAGFDFTFGSKGRGTMEDMRQLGEGVFTAATVGKVAMDDEKISSTRIRGLLAEGKVSETAELLGRPFRSVGTVTDGDKRGRLLGFPTANIIPEDDLIVPKNGVYAVRFTVGGTVYDGVCNIGVKPTFDKPEEAKKTIEVNVFDFDGDLYGKEAAVDWIAFIRPEQKFGSIDDLKSQIGTDKETARAILNDLD